MLERASAVSKLLPLFAADAALPRSAAAAWETLAAPLADKLGLGPARREALQDGCFQTLRAWAALRAEDQPARAPIAQWLVRLRQEMSLEELLLACVRLDRAWRQSAWQLGLSAPDWLALSELFSDFFEAIFSEAAGGFAGLIAQNQLLRDELGYFRRLASALESGIDPGTHLQTAVAETARLLHCEFCAILLPQDDERDVLAIRAAVAPRILSGALEGMSFPLAENGLIAQVFLTGAPASTYQPLDDLEITMRRRQTLESLGFSQLMAYPLQTHGRVLGVLCVANRLDQQPWQALEEEWLGAVAGQLAASIRLTQLAHRQDEGELAMAESLLGMLALRDPLLAAHGLAVGALCQAIGSLLGLSGARLEALRWAGCLHDLGMIGVPDAIRLRPGPLEGADRARVRRHPADGAEAIAPIRALAPLADGLRHHHERWDGQGYPAGLAGQAIPLAARVIAVADAFQTIATAQTYAPARALDEALAAIAAEAGKQFDPLVVQALRETLKERPELVPAQPAGARQASPPVATGSLMALFSELAQARSREELLARFWEAIATHTAIEAGALWRVGAPGALTLDRYWHWEAEPDADLASSGLESYAVACRVPVASADLGSDPRFARPDAYKRERLASALALPLVAGDRTIGALGLYRRTSGPLSHADLAAAELAASALAQALESLELRERLDQAIRRDPLTGAASQRSFMERLASEIKRAERFELPLAALLVDLDGFFDYNEANGYGLGDEVLRELAALLSAHARPGDLVARLDADAFAILLPECAPPDATTLGETLRQAIAAATFPGRQAGGVRLTASVGVTGLERARGGRPTFFHDLRAALAKARQEGANRLVFHASYAPELA